MSKDYWAGALWVYQATITSDGADAGDHIYTLTVGAGNELEVLYGTILNGDTSARNVRVDIDDGANRLGQLLFAVAANAAAYQSFPVAPVEAAGGNVSGAGARYIVAGAMRIVATVFAVAVNQDSAFSIVCRIRGGVPTVAETMSAGTPTILINTEQVF